MALTKLNNKAVANVTTLPVALGDMILVSSATASSSATIDFTLGDYKEYQFYLVNIHPANNALFTFNLSTDSGSNYNVIKTSTYFTAYHNESGADSALQYDSGADLAQSTDFQELTSAKSASDDNCGGTLTLFNPASTTFVKHYICDISNNNTPYSERYNIAGYANTTSALTNIRFKMSSGNIDAGKILMFGIN